MAELKRNFLDSRRFQEEVAKELGIDLRKSPKTLNIAKKEDTLHAEDGKNRETD